MAGPNQVRVQDAAGHLFNFNHEDAAAFIKGNPGASIVEGKPQAQVTEVEAAAEKANASNGAAIESLRADVVALTAVVGDLAARLEAFEKAQVTEVEAAAETPKGKPAKE